ncbi:MAG: tRNA lysidine(34) synthetase TilS [Candidatus Andersenbacteria bacterium]
MVLLELLAEMRTTHELQLSAVHVNYGLRGEASQLDERLVAQRCKDLAVFLTLHRASELHPDDANLEDRARTIRHRVLKQTARELGASAIALGHTRDDQAETVLLHLLRGAGLTGLRGMQPREGQIVRPLFGARRAEVRAYAHAHGVAYRDDASNLDHRFARNRVRHLLLPLLAEQFNPGIVDVLADSAALVAEDERFMDQLAESIYRRFVKEAATKADSGANGTRATIAAEELLELPLALQRRVVRSMVRAVAPTHVQPGHGRALQAALDGLAASRAGVEFPLGRGLTLTRLRGTVAVQFATSQTSRRS